MNVLQLAGCALLCAVTTLLLSQLRPALAPAARLCGTLIPLGAALLLYAPVLARVEALFALAEAGELAAPILRALGIALICELTAILCRDLGERGLAQGVQLFGKLEIILLSLPLLDQILDIAKELLDY